MLRFLMFQASYLIESKTMLLRVIGSPNSYRYTWIFVPYFRNQEKEKESRRKIDLNELSLIDEEIDLPIDSVLVHSLFRADGLRGIEKWNGTIFFQFSIVERCMWLSLSSNNWRKVLSKCKCFCFPSKQQLYLIPVLRVRILFVETNFELLEHKLKKI